MTALNSYYIALLKDKKIVYMPTCLVIERMTKLYSHISKIQSQVDLLKKLKEVMFLLRYFQYELKCTSSAYEEARIKFFVGDWKQDRLRSKKLFSNLQARLDHFGDNLGSEPKKRLRDVSDGLGHEWEHLGAILDRQCGLDTTAECGTRCRYFRCTSATCWQQTMAKAILSLGGLADCREPESYLLLLCYTRVKIQILREIELLERKYNITEKFPAEKILCISDAETTTNCPNCMTMVNGLGQVNHRDPNRGAHMEKYTRTSGRRAAAKRVRDSHVYVPRGGLLPSALAFLSRGSS